MPNSYVEYVSPGPTNNHRYTVFDANGGIDGYIDKDFLEVYVNNTKIPYGTVVGSPYWTLTELPEYSTVRVNIFNTSGINAGSSIRIQRVTPSTVDDFKADILEFFNTEILNAEQLNLALRALIHLVQEAKEQGALVTTGGEYLPKDTTNPLAQFWTAQGLDIRNLPATPSTATSAASKGWVESAIAASGGGGGGGGGGGPWGTSDIIDGAITTAKIAAEAVETGKLAAEAVTTAKIALNAVTTGCVADGAITDAKIAPSPDGGATGIDGSKIKILSIPTSRLTGTLSIQAIAGTSGALNDSVLGTINSQRENFACTQFARTLLDDANASAARTTLGLGNVATVDTISNTNVASNAAIALTKLAQMGANTVVANNASTTGAPSATTMDTIPVNKWGTATGTLNMGAQRIVNSTTPIDSQDLATKGYVDSTVSGWPGVYNGTDENNATYPIGTTILVIEEGGTPTAKAANSVQNVRYQTANNTFYFGTAASGYVALAGTWRARGSFIVTVTLTTYGIHLVQRTA